MSGMGATSTTSSVHPHVSSFKERMFNSCNGIANVCNLIGISRPHWQSDTTTPINREFDFAIENAARMPDELARSMIQIAGAQLHTVGMMFRNDFTSPYAIAPLARSAIENIALLLLLNQDESPSVRTVRAARAIRVGMKIDDVHKIPGLDELYADLNRMVVKYTTKNEIKDLRIEKLEYTKLVNSKIGELIGENVYSELCGYTHPNCWKSFAHFLAANADRTAFEMESLYFAYKVSIAVAGAGLVLLGFRDVGDTEELGHYLNDSISRLKGLGDELDRFNAELAASSH